MNLQKLMAGLLNAAEKLEANAINALSLEKRKGECARKRRAEYHKLIRICWDIDSRFARFKKGGIRV